MNNMAFSSQTVAVVDLGSNSFHMLIASVEGGRVRIIDRLRETVRLGQGLSEGERTLHPQAAERALACLRRLGERVRMLPQGSVRAVGTNALRQAKKQQGFLDEAERVLGHPIEIISGAEEARLIFLGVAHDTASHCKRLVVDIGGGSTECIIGQGFHPVLAESTHMGCVAYSQRFFPKGQWTSEGFRKAELAAALELQNIRETFTAEGWEEAVGSSGTVLAVAETLHKQGWSEGAVTSEGLLRLRRAMVTAGHASALHLEGLDTDRLEVLAGGLAVLTAVFEVFGLHSMQPVSGALREGVLYELLGRIQHEDIRQSTVESMAQRYHIDMSQAVRVRGTALFLLEQTTSSLQMVLPHAPLFLSWAALLHEIGLAISHSGYHKHGAYILSHADMPGFSKQDQDMLSCMVRAHRRKLAPHFFEELSGTYAEDAAVLCLLFRLACCLHRNRSPQPLPLIKMGVSGRVMSVGFPAQWIQSHPLTHMELQEECERWPALKWQLNIHTF
jgi:exopolyphosphatase/guanosine-5'-triphosphate,3'-diphosphate pyrophosphatase